MNKYQEALNHIINCDREDNGMSYLSDAYRNDISTLFELITKYGKLENMHQKALWALSELMGDKGIYINVGYKTLYFPSFEKLRGWIETE